MYAGYTNKKYGYKNTPLRIFSVLKLHANHHHGGADVRFTMKLTGLHNDSLDRQVTEGVNIANFGGDVLMNRRGELGGVRIERQQYRRWGAN